MSIYDQIAVKIIKEQELLMGPIAWNEAGKVKGLRVIDKNKGDVLIEDPKDSNMVLDNLVKRFEHLFGRAGREVCREAVSAMVADLKPSQVPSSLK
jgi:hypothetical protein